jgi:hypothetical protein
MSSSIPTTPIEPATATPPKEISIIIDREYKKVSSIIPPQNNTQTTYRTEMGYDAMENLLEKEKNKNKTESWNKLDKTRKIQLLQQYAETYGVSQGYHATEIQGLQQFFVNCLNNNKLQKTKEVLYDKENQKITGIPALCFNRVSQHFTLKIIDTKRVSTLKSLAPKK